MTLFRFHRQARNMSKLETQVEKMIAEQASEWVDVMKKPTFLDRRLFARWLKKHDRHATDYLFMEALDQALEGIDPQRLQSVEKLLSEPVAEVVPLQVDRRPLIGQTNRKVWSRAVGSVAIAAAAALIWFVTPWHGIGWSDVSTRVGEQRVLNLEDGSTVYLNTRSRIQVKLSSESRDIRLLSGEALFKVERDPTRPFSVRAGNTTIRVLGTEFNVYRKDNATQVAVLEGKVEVSNQARTETRPPLQLTAGEETRVTNNAPATKYLVADLTQTTAWRQRRLMFRLDTLADIAAEFNRYNRLPQIRIAEDIRTRRFSGVFDADDPDAFAEMLSGDNALAITKNSEEIVIRIR